MPAQQDSIRINTLYQLLTEFEKLGCFEIGTTPQERKKIAKLLIEVIEKGMEDDLLEKRLEDGYE